MFEKITLKNFRTHTETTLDLGAVTLFIGPNNAGKSNLLAGIRHLSRLTARGRPYQQALETKEEEVRGSGPEHKQHNKLRAADFFPHRHRLAQPDAAIGFSSVWTHKLGRVEYRIDLYERQELEKNVGCSESIRILPAKSGESIEKRTGSSKPIDELRLQTKLESEDLKDEERELTGRFFRDLASCYIYNFQPSFLKGTIQANLPPFDPERLAIASLIGFEGSRLQELLKVVQERDEMTFNRFLASLRRFDPSFHGIGYDQNRRQVNWLFDLGRVPARLDEFSPDVVSDGLLRAAAIALLSSMRNPPALILVEEIENGISQRNLGRFLDWLHQAAGTPSSKDRGYNTQFIVTSHSPSVLREFSDHLDDVFHVRLERRGYRSVVTNLNSSLAAFVDMGTVEGEYEDRNGKRIVKISPERLIELWYSGAIGGEPEL